MRERFFVGFKVCTSLHVLGTFLSAAPRRLVERLQLQMPAGRLLGQPQGPPGKRFSCICLPKVASRELEGRIKTVFWIIAV